MQEGLFEFSPDGRMVKLKKTMELKNFKVNVLNAYMSKQDVVETDRAETFHSPILPCPVATSPLYVVLHQAKPVRSHMNSVDQLLTLRHIFKCFCDNPYMPHVKDRTQQVSKMIKTFHDHLEKEDDTFHEHMDDLVNQFVEKKCNERMSLERFLDLVHKHTFRQTVLYESVIMDVLGIKNVPFSSYELLSANVFDAEEFQRFCLACRFFYDAKQKLMNYCLRQASESESFTDRTWFQINDMERRWQSTPPDEVFYGFIDRLTAWEYLKFYDTDDLIK